MTQPLLAIALVFTPWLSKRLLSHASAAHQAEAGEESRLHRFFERVMSPFLRGDKARPSRHKLYLGTLVAIGLNSPRISFGASGLGSNVSC